MLKDENGQLIQVGHTLPGPVGASVMYVFEYGTEETSGGVVLAYSAHKREYWVWRVNATTGELMNGVYRYVQQDAMNTFFERSMSCGYSYMNMMAPALSYAITNGE
jgi:hypothetical protein